MGFIWASWRYEEEKVGDGANDVGFANIGAGDVNGFFKIFWMEGYTRSKDSLLSAFYWVIREFAMLAKLTAKNQLTLPKSIIRQVGESEYFDVRVEGGEIILTPVKIQRADAVRAKLAALDLSEQDIVDAVAWARQS